jgi:hypothetical protein
MNTGYTITSLDYGNGSYATPSVHIPDHNELTRRIAEDAFDWPFPPRWMVDDLNPMAGQPFRGATGTTNDRRSGRDLPLYWSEVDLRGFRVLSRWLCDTNDFAIGFLNLLVGYNVRKGFGWQACKRGAKKGPYQTVGTPTDPVIAKGQKILDEWRDASLWPVRSREAFRRWRRDGEVAVRFFYGGWNRLPAIRFVGPEQIGSPEGQTDGPCSFGIETESHDVETVLAYHIWDMESGMTRGQWVDANRIIFVKANVDSDVKRGLPDFFPVHESLDGVRRLLRNMLLTSIRQAAIAWREKFGTATATQAAGIVPERATGYGGSVPATNAPPNWPWWMGSPQQWGYNRMDPGTVIRTEGNREFEEGPTSSGVGNYIQAAQAVLRSVCVRWGMPEYASGDASNNNFASALVAGSPFTVVTEGVQLEWGALFERPVALKVLDLATEAGMLSPEERRQLDVEVTEPAVVTPQPEKDTQTYTQQLQAKIVCLDTVRQKLGYDPQHEAEGVKKDAEQAAKEQQQAQQQQPGQQPLKAMESEAQRNAFPSPLSTLQSRLADRSGSDEEYTLEEFQRLAEAGWVWEGGAEHEPLVMAQRWSSQHHKQVRMVKRSTIGRNGWEPFDSSAQKSANTTEKPPEARRPIKQATGGQDQDEKSTGQGSGGNGKEPPDGGKGNGPPDRGNGASPSSPVDPDEPSNIKIKDLEEFRGIKSKQQLDLLVANKILPEKWAEVEGTDNDSVATQGKKSDMMKKHLSERSSKDLYALIQHYADNDGRGVKGWATTANEVLLNRTLKHLQAILAEGQQPGWDGEIIDLNTMVNFKLITAAGGKNDKFSKTQKEIVFTALLTYNEKGKKEHELQGKDYTEKVFARITLVNKPPQEDGTPNLDNGVYIYPDYGSNNYKPDRSPSSDPANPESGWPIRVMTGPEFESGLAEPNKLAHSLSTKMTDAFNYSQVKGVMEKNEQYMNVESAKSTAILMNRSAARPGGPEGSHLDESAKALVAGMNNTVRQRVAVETASSLPPPAQAKLVADVVDKLPPEAQAEHAADVVDKLPPEAQAEHAANVVDKLPPEAQAEHVKNVAKKLTPDEQVGLLQGMAANMNPEEQVGLLQGMAANMNPEDITKAIAALQAKLKTGSNPPT